MKEITALNEEYEDFYEEYEALCKKHGLMVLSDGEQVQIGSRDEKLWGLKESTIDWANSVQKYGEYSPFEEPNLTGETQ